MSVYLCACACAMKQRRTGFCNVYPFFPPSMYTVPCTRSTQAFIDKGVKQIDMLPAWLPLQSRRMSLTHALKIVR